MSAATSSNGRRRVSDSAAPSEASHSYRNGSTTKFTSRSAASSSSSSTSKGASQSRVPSRIDSISSHPSVQLPPPVSPPSREASLISSTSLQLLDRPPSGDHPSDRTYSYASRPASSRPPTIPPKEDDRWLYPAPTDAQALYAHADAHTPRSSATISDYGQLIERGDSIPYRDWDWRHNRPAPIVEEKESVSDLSAPGVEAPTVTPPPRSPVPPATPTRAVSHKSASSSSATKSPPRPARSSSSSSVPRASVEAPRTPVEVPRAPIEMPTSPPQRHSALSPPTVSRTLDDVRDQVATSTALRALRKAQTVDGTKAGVVMTLSKHEDAKFLQAVAAHLAHLHPSDATSYVYAVFTSPASFVPSPGARRFTASSLLLAGSAPALVRRAVMLACAKFLSRVEEIEAGGTYWLGLLHDAPAPLPAGDEDMLWDVVRKAALTQSAAPRDPYAPPPGSLSIDDVLARARGQLERLTPEQARAALLADAEPPALLIDIRPAAQRAAHGGIHGSLLIERNVLEWRLDPRSYARLSIADRYDLRAIIFCQEGYTSSLAAAALQELGLWNATDVAGGFAAWKLAGLPTELQVDDASDDGRSEVASSVVAGTSIVDGGGVQDDE